MRKRTPVLDTDVVEGICSMNWRGLSKDSLIDAAWAYYFFSVQFRENLKIARRLFPEDSMLEELEADECDTANLSPWRGVAGSGERLDHDEFMQRSLALTTLDERRVDRLQARGMKYLESIRTFDDRLRALSMASYEGGGLQRVFRAMLTAADWSDPALQAFRHFLIRHVELDGHHGFLVGHLNGHRETIPLWTEFERLLVDCVPDLAVKLRTTKANGEQGNTHEPPSLATRSETARPEQGLGTADVDCPITAAGTV